MRRIAIVGVAGLLFGFVGAEIARAQPTSASVYQSSGLVASIGNIVARGRFVTVQIGLTNSTGRRFYLLLTGSQSASLSSGDLLDLQNVVGVSYCSATNGDDANLEGCMNPGHSADPSHYTVIEPGAKTVMAFRYRLSADAQPAIPGDTISFALKGILRTGDAEAVAGRERPTEPSPISIDFPLIRIP